MCWIWGFKIHTLPWLSGVFCLCRIFLTNNIKKTAPQQKRGYLMNWFTISNQFWGFVLSLIGLCQADNRPNPKGFPLSRIGCLDRFAQFCIWPINFTVINLQKELIINHFISIKYWFVQSEITDYCWKSAGNVITININFIDLLSNNLYIID